MDSVDDGFEDSETPWGQANASTDDDTVIGVRRQQTLHGRPGGLIRPNETHVAFPPPRGELLESNFNSGVNLLNAHAWRQSGVREVHSFRIVANQQNSLHEFSPCSRSGLADGASAASRA